MLSLAMLKCFLATIVFQVISVQVDMHDLLHKSFVLLQVDLRLNQLTVRSRPKVIIAGDTSKVS